MAIMNFTMEVEVKALRVTSDFFELMKQANSDDLVQENDKITFNGLPIIIDESVDKLDADIDAKLIKNVSKS